MNCDDLAVAPIREVKRREPLAVAATTPTYDVVQLMTLRSRGAVLITGEDERLVGIFTESDLCRRVDLRDEGWHQHPISEYMTTRMKTARSESSIATALLTMTAGGFRHLPVLDREGTPVAIISVRDVIAHIAECLPKEFINLPPDPDHEAREPWGG